MTTVNSSEAQTELHCSILCLMSPGTDAPLQGSPATYQHTSLIHLAHSLFQLHSLQLQHLGVWCLQQDHFHNTLTAGSPTVKGQKVLHDPSLTFPFLMAHTQVEVTQVVSSWEFKQQSEFEA